MEKLPIEILYEKYVPLSKIESYGYEKEEVEMLIKDHKIRYAEFKEPGKRFRSVHVNIEEVATFLSPRATT